MILKKYILLLYLFIISICNAQKPIDLLSNNNYRHIKYDSESFNSKIKFNNIDSLTKSVLSNDVISQIMYEGVNKNTVFISSLICFKIKNKKVLFKQNLKGFNLDEIDLQIVNVLKENIKHEDFLNLKNNNKLGFFIYFNFKNTEIGFELVELKGKKELLISKQKINYLTLEKIN